MSEKRTTRQGQVKRDKFETFLKMNRKKDLSVTTLWQEFNKLQKAQGEKGIQKKLALDLARELTKKPKKAYSTKKVEKSAIRYEQYYHNNVEYVNRQKDLMSSIGLTKVQNIHFVIRINIKHSEDEFTHNNYFTIWIPFYKHQKDISINTIKKYIRDFLGKSYPSIVKRYIKDSEKQNKLLQDIQNLKKDLKNINDLKSLRNTFADNNFFIDDIKRENWIDPEARKMKKLKSKKKGRK